MTVPDFNSPTELERQTNLHDGLLEAFANWHAKNPKIIEHLYPEMVRFAAYDPEQDPNGMLGKLLAPEIAITAGKLAYWAFLRLMAEAQKNKTLPKPSKKRKRK